MKLKDIFILAALARGRELDYSAGIGVMIFFFLCSVAIIIAGLVSGYWQWAVIAGIGAIIDIIIAAILIFLNIRRNSNRW